MAPPTSPGASTPVWDVPVRLFHWALVLLVCAQVATGFTGGNAMFWHERGGVAILALVLFRLAWGVVGSRHARFRDFLYGPAASLAFARDLLLRRAQPYLGHNPLGGWNVLLMLMLILLQAASGLFANDDILSEGPLAKLVSKDTSDAITGFHELNGKAIIALVALHVIAVLYHGLALGENLIRAMFTGRKPIAANDSSAPFVSPWRALLVAGLAALIVYLVVSIPK